MDAVAIPDERSCLSDERQKTFQVSESEIKDLIRPTASHGPTACLGEKTIHHSNFSALSQDRSMLRGTVRSSYRCGCLRKASEGVQMNDTVEKWQIIF